MGFSAPTTPDQPTLPAHEHRMPAEQPGRKHPFHVPRATPFQDGKNPQEKAVTPPPPPALPERTFGKSEVTAVVPLPGILLKESKPNVREDTSTQQDKQQETGSTEPYVQGDKGNQPWLKD